MDIRRAYICGQFLSILLTYFFMRSFLKNRMTEFTVLSGLLVVLVWAAKFFTNLFLT